jgi:hypothetical protein
MSTIQPKPISSLNPNPDTETESKYHDEVTLYRGHTNTEIEQCANPPNYFNQAIAGFEPYNIWDY